MLFLFSPTELHFISSSSYTLAIDRQMGKKKKNCQQLRVSGG